MQIHEITEGLLSNVARGFVQGVTGTHFDQNRPVQLPASTVERTTVTLLQPGNTVPSKYYKTNNVWTNELGQVIQGMRQKAYLEKMVATHGKKEMIPLQTVATAPSKKSRRAKVAS